MKFRVEAGVVTDPIVGDSSHDTQQGLHDLCCHGRCAAEVVRGRAAEAGKLVS